MDPCAYQELSSGGVQTTGSAEWDQTLNDFIDFGTPKPGESHDTTSSVEPPNSPSVRYGTYGQWLTVPQQHDAVQQEHFHGSPGKTSEAQHNVTNAREVELQRQINELRAMVSSLMEETRQSRDTSGLAEGNGNLSSRPSTPLGPDMFGSFSFDQPSRNGGHVSQGWCTPSEPLGAPFEPSDDSPIYSRRGSAASVGSATAKRGQRIAGGYACNTCDYKFDVPSQLRHHERKHISKDNRPHACALCGDRFLFPKDVARHERQVHSISRSSAWHSADADANNRGNQTGPRTVTDERRKRRRHLSQLQASRGRRTEFLRQMESTARTASIEHRDPESRRDSAIADMETINIEHIRDEAPALYQETLSQQVAAQQRDIKHLEQLLQQSREESLALSTERDAFAEIFSRTAIFPDPYQEAEAFQPATVTCARSWLSAIEALLSSSDSPTDTEPHIADAVKSIASALDNVHIEASTI